MVIYLPHLAYVCLVMMYDIFDGHVLFQDSH
jgi:hypothetical protein